MTTLVMPQGATPSPDPVHTPNGPIRYVAIRANLLPRELVQDRRSGVVKRRIVMGLAAVVAVIAVLYGLTLWGTAGARHDLSQAHKQNAALEAQQQKYQPLTAAQTQSAAINDALHKLMVGDLSWKDMLTTLRDAAPKGLKVDSVAGTITIGAGSAVNSGFSASGPGIGALNTTGQPPAGTLNITGSAPDKDTVAAYAAALGKVTGLAAPYPTNVTTTGPGVTFAISAVITTDALGGRYSTKSTSPGGN